MAPSREILWNIDHSWVMYACMVAAFTLAGYFFFRKYRLWKVGGPEDRSDRRGERLRGAFFKALLHSAVVRERTAGFMHAFMYAGFGIMLLATALTALQYDFGVEFIYGDFYLYFMSLTVDLAGLAFVVAMIALIVRRVLDKSLESKPGDYAVLIALLLVGLGGFVVEGLRIEGTDDPWRMWSPVGSAVGQLFAWMTPEQNSTAHKIAWWSHMALAFALLASWTYSKLIHVLLVPGSVYWRNLDNRAKLPFVDCENDELETMGVGKLEDFTWKDLYDLEACVGCGRCERSCPAHLSGKGLSPKSLMSDLRVCLEEQAPLLLKGLREEGLGEPSGEASGEEKMILEKTLCGSYVSSDALWACTTCGSCLEQCPALLEPTPKVVKMRTYQTSMEGEFPPEAQQAFRGLEKNGNPWGLGWQSRLSWADGLDVPLLEDNPDADYLFWPGCAGAYDARAKKVSRAFVQLMKMADVDFAILGNDERCCGDSARRLGNEFLYYQLASENIASLKERGVRKIVTQCPHCYSALSCDYPQLGGDFEVVHHSELLASLVAEGRLAPSGEKSLKATYHDPCYLGRYNGVYDAPRMLIEAAGAELLEMDRNREASFCCGAGGGRMWLEEHGERINRMRAAQASDTGAQLVVSACPFCLSMLSDGTAAECSDLSVRDIAEVLLDACAPNENDAKDDGKAEGMVLDGSVG